MSPTAKRLPTVVVPIAILTGLILIPHRALAEYQGSHNDVGPYVIAAVVLPVPVADVVFAVYDLDRAFAGERASKAMAITETAIAAPQAAVASAFVMTSNSAIPIPLAIYTVSMLGLTLHGIISLLPPSPSCPTLPQPPTPSDPNRVRISVIPTMVGDGSQLVPGLGAVGRF